MKRIQFVNKKPEFTAQAGVQFETVAGTLNLGVDVEFDYTSETDSNLFSGGRLLLDINGEKVLANGNFASFKLNPTWGQDGDVGADNIWIKFGVQNNWAIQAGQDTYVAASGTTMYRANFARGRTNEKDDTTGADGQLTFTKTMGDAAGFELTAQSLNDGDTVIVRPVMTYAADKVSMAFGLELPVAATDNDDYAAIGGSVDDGMKWIGSGATVSYQATDDLALTLRAAYLADDRVDNNEIDAMTAGINAQYQNFFIGALYGEVDADLAASNSEEIQVYASYRIPTLLEIQNFDLYLGAGYSDSKVNGVNKDDVVGARARLKYVF